jgi:hypothetical protein
MKPVMRIVGLLLGFLLGQVLQAQSLWPGTTAGMSLAEVQKACPDAREPENAGELPAGRGTELLMLDQTVIAGHRFKVRFYFKTERLVHVALTETGEIPMKELEKFHGLLRAKYGMEYSMQSSESVGYTWKAVQTTILLKWSPLGHGMATLTITYEAPIPKETERL